MAVVGISYALGCWTTGYYLVKWRLGRDVRNLGSGNLGARNAGRQLGRWGFGLTLISDVVKGGLAVWLAMTLDVSPLAQAGAMIAVVLGHVMPVQLGFRGGKGAATALGVLVTAQPWTALPLALAFGIVMGGLRRFTLAGLAAFAVLPPVVAWRGVGPMMTMAMTAVVMIVIVAHGPNLRDELRRFRPAAADSRRRTRPR